MGWWKLSWVFRSSSNLLDGEIDMGLKVKLDILSTVLCKLEMECSSSESERGIKRKIELRIRSEHR